MTGEQALELANQAYDLLERIHSEFDKDLRQIEGGDAYQYSKDAVQSVGELVGLLEEHT